MMHAFSATLVDDLQYADTAARCLADQLLGCQHVVGWEVCLCHAAIQVFSHLALSVCLLKPGTCFVCEH